MVDKKTSRQERTKQIREFILSNAEFYPKNLISITAQRFGISRQAVNKHLAVLKNEGAISVEGRTKAASYKLLTSLRKEFNYEISKDTGEDEVWRKDIRSLLEGIDKNVLDICQYGFTEIFNNAIDHSEGTRVTVQVERRGKIIEIQIEDNGIGIFTKIQKEFNLSSTREAVLELVKGKLTTDPERHTGEGIFFTSRIFDAFSIMSADFSFHHLFSGDDWILEGVAAIEGTIVMMQIRETAAQTTEEVFDQFIAEGEKYSFSKTHIPVFLAQFGDEQLVSRSQARRVLARAEQFKEVWLDFDNVESIGQAFADEIFRVFRNSHPDVIVIYSRANPKVLRTIQRVSTDSDQQYRLDI
ncbi:MAG: DUF4325 domain-containing protein [Anaerolineales bacterium]|jgi:anti-sigma regulatory factor (Ser/Thr protein kinase)/biotin operon repressor|nr:DUF4325 domain-containing protein [Anaerolineales bacterium]